MKELHENCEDIIEEKEKIPVSWTPYQETLFVRHLGTGRWSVGSNDRHPRDWWLQRYIQLNTGRTEPYILAGLIEANKILGLIKKT